MKQLENLCDFYKNYLINVCMPFWHKNAIDNEYGGYYTCLEKNGGIYNTDKSVWFQGRGLWMFSKLYNEAGGDPKWLEAAKTGYEFLMANCFDSDGKMYFTVTREGKPLQKRRYLFSETFAIIGLAEYSKASGNKEALIEAKKIFSRIVKIYKTPEMFTPKIDPGTRPMKGLSLPMILLSTIQTLRSVELSKQYDELAEEIVNTILSDFFKPEERALFEIVGVNGERLDTPQGRCINPGHSIETAWFLLQEGLYTKKPSIIEKALNILDFSIEIGWDKENGGIFSFVDIEGKPPEQLEWDMKMWWPHTEAIYAFLLAFSITTDTKYKIWHDKVHEWAFKHFADPEYGEWYGYLHSDGTVANNLKGSIWKGMFHLPRALFMSYNLLDQMISKEHKKQFISTNKN